jgi:undecaprenyl diphosphate synthase
MLTKLIMIIPRHIAYIMDGNGRWAQERGMPRTAGHRAGINKIEHVLRICHDLKIEVVSAFGWSTENWSRPYKEVKHMMNALEKDLPRLAQALNKEGVRFVHSGSLDRLTIDAQEQIKWATTLTKNNGPFIFNLAFNYGGRAEIVHAIRGVLSDGVLKGKINDSAIGKYLWTEGLPDVDLLIRPGGEKRISNFMLWQIAYAHIYFTDIYWPDMDEREIHKAIVHYHEKMKLNTSENRSGL